MPHEGMRVEPRAQDRPTTKGLAHAGRLRSHHVHAVTLGPAAGAKTLTRPGKGAPLQVGFNRDVAPLATATLAAAALEWESLADGKHVAAIRIDSAGASALRAGLRIVDLPDDALLRFTDGSDSELFEVSGHDVNAALRRNADAGDAGGEAGLWWSPVIEGEAISIEVELDAASDPSAVRIAIPRVSHLFTSASNAFATPTTLGRSEACEVDASCSTDLPSEKNAVAEMVFSDSTGSFLCTGTLLADQDSATNAPYFLSANHCISSQGVASTLVTYWFYRSSACNSGAPGAYRQLTGGATLLYHTTATDTSFMRLNNTPPQGTYFAGWSTSATPSLGTAVTALHQPRGDLLKISKGQVGGFLTCTAPTNGGFSCSNASSASSTFYDVGWSRGVTEPGSSGSALFDGNYVVGQLYGGSGDCTTPGDDAYGRFDVAYRNALKTWLSPPLALTVARSGSGTGTVTSSPAGISCGATCSASFDAGTSVTLNASASAGSTFTGWTGACSGTGACTVAMGAATTVGATFQGNATLSVSTSGNGRVSSVPSGIDCGSACAATFATGTAVTLAATPSTGSVFKGWGGACSGTGSCAITLRGAASVTASFGAPSADVALAQSANPAAPIAGKDVVLDLVATNNGPDAASNVTIADAVPAGTQLVWLSPNCSQAGAAISCRIGTLASHASGNATVVVRPLAAGTLTHAASASAAEPDPAPADNASSTTLAVGAVAAGVPVPRYRLYSPITREHLFTTDLNEYQTLGAQAGTWVQEGLSGHVLDNPGSFNGVTAVPYYRLYNTTTWWHHWTTDANEYYTLTRAPNWNAEGIDGYILPTSTTGAEPLYRLLYPDGRGLHHWTIDADEYNILVGTYGWVGEGGSGFVIR
jgi:uncharacterized repeat protein (TIGR01451 family)